MRAQSSADKTERKEKGSEAENYTAELIEGLGEEDGGCAGGQREEEEKIRLEVQNLKIFEKALREKVSIAQKKLFDASKNNTPLKSDKSTQQL